MSAVPRTSVITIFLDEVGHLREAVDSVLAQTTSDWELLLVDDGSTDGSGELARALARQSPDRIRCLAHPGGANRGMSASRNLGLAHARGRQIAFLDADDVYLPDKLRHQSALLDTHRDAALVYGPMTLWHGWTGDEADARLDRVRPTRLPAGTVLTPPAAALAWVQGTASVPATCSVLVRREAVDRVGGFEERFRGMYEDQAFFVKLGVSVAVLVDDVPLDLYRQHPASTSQRALADGSWRRGRTSPTQRAYLEWLDEHLRQQPAATADVRRAARRALLPYRHPRTARAVAAAQHVRRRLRALPGRLRPAGAPGTADPGGPSTR